MKTASSEVIRISRSSKRPFRRSTVSRTPSEIEIVLDWAWRTTPSPMIGRPSRRTKLVASAGAKKASATSPTRVLPSMMTSLTRSGVAAVASARTNNCWSSERKLPTGTSKGAWLSASATSPTVRPKRLRRSGSITTRRRRWRSPNMSTLATPSMERNSGTMSFSTMAVSVSSSCMSESTAIWTMGSALSSAFTTRICSTRSGSWRATRDVASRMSAAAESRSTPGLNSTRMREPFSSLCASISRTPETRATAPSRMLVTSASTVSGAAPGKFAVTDTTGRSTSGSSRTSTPNSAARPPMMISRLRTATRTGRLTASAGRSLRCRLIGFRPRRWASHRPRARSPVRRHRQCGCLHEPSARLR